MIDWTPSTPSWKDWVGTVVILAALLIVAFSAGFMLASIR